ncbi:MAG: 3-isopropylmalate dehydratase small subunit [Synergistaceae bacterium]|jgi:3-isopropylmalate/(R)-2-methylmalate dehydratase small subunit|nr:3-isopropylmalate dehydratase small subunit [Synergistaceae bacterium]
MNRCWKMGDNISTDEILPSQYMTLTEKTELARHLMENAAPDFARLLKPGDIILGGNNFGYGSSREHAPLALKGAEVGAIVAKSFARIFFRNCINIGLPAITCPEAADEIQDGSCAAIDLANGVIISGKSYGFDPFPDFIMECIREGGLISALNKRRNANR